MIFLNTLSVSNFIITILCIIGLLLVSILIDCGNITALKGNDPFPEMSKSIALMLFIIFAIVPVLNIVLFLTILHILTAKEF